MEVKLLCVIVFLLFLSCNDGSVKEMRPVMKNDVQTSVYPLITIDPTINAWSTSPTLYTSQPKTLTGKMIPLVGLIRVDGEVFRFMGTEEVPDEAIADTSTDTEWIGKYTFTHPEDKWQQIDFDDSRWARGKAPFASPNIPDVRTIWPSPAIWVRREINIHPNQLDNDLYLKYSHDDVLEIYINGILLVKTGYEWKKDATIEISDEIKKTFHTGKIVIAASCKNLEGEAYLDFGIYIAHNKKECWSGKYTFTTPPEGWKEVEYNDSEWNHGKAPFGTPVDYPVNTTWDTPEIWVRREVTLDQDVLTKSTLMLDYSHDENLELYINGVQLVKTGYEWRQNVILEIPESVRRTIKDGKVVVALHCKNASGGALVDFKIYGENIVRQKSVDVQATQTHYVFECGGVELNLTFTAPLFDNCIESLSLPLNYITYKTNSIDNNPHRVEIYIETATDCTSKKINWAMIPEVYEKDNLLFIKTGKKEQHIFEFDEESKEPEWGYFYIATDKTSSTGKSGHSLSLRKEFSERGSLLYIEPVKSNCIAVSTSLGNSMQMSGHIMIGHDDVYSIQYFGDNIYPYWNRKGEKTIEQLFVESNKNYSDLIQKCNVFDSDITKLPLSYRLLVSSGKLAETPDAELLFFTKRNIMDVAPAIMAFSSDNTQLLKAMIKPVFYYCESNKWTQNYPPVNLGSYPVMNGQVSDTDLSIKMANLMLNLTAAVTVSDGNADFAKQHWGMLTKWYNYLIENQVLENINGEFDLRVIKSNSPDLFFETMTGISSFNYMKERVH